MKNRITRLVDHTKLLVVMKLTRRLAPYLGDLRALIGYDSDRQLALEQLVVNHLSRCARCNHLATRMATYKAQEDMPKNAYLFLCDRCPPPEMHDGLPLVEATRWAHAPVLAGWRHFDDEGRS